VKDWAVQKVVEAGEIVADIHSAGIAARCSGAASVRTAAPA
jgi:hypothetical protein